MKELARIPSYPSINYAHEDPPPSRGTMDTIEFDNRPRQNVAECRHEEIDEIPPAHALLNLKGLRCCGEHSKAPPIMPSCHN
jgi:hypothetical protein